MIVNSSTWSSGAEKIWYSACATPKLPWSVSYVQPKCCLIILQVFLKLHVTATADVSGWILWDRRPRSPLSYSPLELTRPYPDNYLELSAGVRSYLLRRHSRLGASGVAECVRHTVRVSTDSLRLRHLWETVHGLSVMLLWLWHPSGTMYSWAPSVAMQLVGIWKIHDELMQLSAVP